METLKVKILNPKVKNILLELAELKLISLKEIQNKTDFHKILKKLRKYSVTAPNLNVIAEEVEVVRKERYES
jgi:hypothetical protein